MKNLKNTIKTLSILLIFSFSACKKDKNSDSENGQIDLTQYTIVGKYETTASAKTFQLPFVGTFSPLAKVILYDGYSNPQGNYLLENGTLTITMSPSSKLSFKIEGENLISVDPQTSGINFKSFKLIKTPSENLLNGSTFSGGLSSTSSPLMTITRFKFTNAQYGQNSLSDPVPNLDYTLINNVAATSNTGANGLLSFFVLIDGKLEIVRYSQNTISYGTFNKTN